ncbi:RNA-binding S4 domain-containing protein [Mycoplasma sp. 1654_15]|uniref:RNA-binding S4 domain-containing protein n=1 Tax=Mycoplasma sp. 1654_15 TaxID=2725994 RepID=UPI001449D456|nr:RNA-binding S4 domain-containing protein [Mycoplasma sp. 1654_15]QJB70918.1 RNA-binding S4 domain-containing protein [Mycoplasma sp. 1654_15]
MIIRIKGESIKMSQFLKKIDIVDSGGQSKYFLLKNEVKVNGVVTKAKGRNLYPGDVVELLNRIFKIEKEEKV